MSIREMHPFSDLIKTQQATSLMSPCRSSMYSSPVLGENLIAAFNMAFDFLIISNFSFIKTWKFELPVIGRMTH